MHASLANDGFPRAMPRIALRVLALRALALMSLLLAALPAQAEIAVTDLAGHEIRLAGPAQRIVLGEGRHLSVLGMLMPDPVSRVVGWRRDKPLDPATLDAWRKTFPALGSIADVGTGNRGLSVEAVLAADPDLVLLSLMDGSDPGVQRARAQIEAAGIPVATVDFFSDPMTNTLPSLRLIAALTGTEARAEEFASFYTDHLSALQSRLARVSDRPSAFLHVHAAPSGCCSTVGSGVFDGFVTAAGGRNVAADAVPGVMGQVSLEYLLGADPDFYVATGGAHMAARGGLVLGAGVAPEAARASLDALTGAAGFADLRAVRDGDALGVWHLFNDSPAHIALIERLALMFHPAEMEGIDPDATLAEIDRRFSAVVVPGTPWVAP